MRRRDFLHAAAPFVLVNGQRRCVQAATDSDERSAAAASKGREFMASLLDPTLGLLPEHRGARVYWLYHDNYLAAKVLRASHPGMSGRIEKAIQGYGVTKSGKIEILFGEAQHPLPFRHPELIEVKPMILGTPR
jgi:hypothetical protein